MEKESETIKITDFSMLLLKKLYLIEGVAIRHLSNKYTVSDYCKAMKNIQELCAESPNGIEERFRSMTEGHTKVGE